MKGQRMMCKHIAEKCFSSWQNKSLLKRRSSSSLFHQHFLPFPLSFIRLHIHSLLSHIFLRTQRGMTEETRDLWKDQGCKASSSQFLVILTSSLFFLSSSKPFFCFRSPSWTHALVLLCVYLVVVTAQGFDALKALCLIAQMLVF